MTLGILCGSIIKTSALTLLGSMAMRAIEQKDYEKLIKFTGVSQITVDVVTYLKYIEENPPFLIRLIQSSGEGWKKFGEFMTPIIEFFSE